jgi:hypothetical protein
MLLALNITQIYWIDSEMKLADGSDQKLMHKFNAIRREERRSIKLVTTHSNIYLYVDKTGRKCTGLDVYTSRQDFCHTQYRFVSNFSQPMLDSQQFATTSKIAAGPNKFRPTRLVPEFFSRMQQTENRNE